MSAVEVAQGAMFRGWNKRVAVGDIPPDIQETMKPAAVQGELAPEGAPNPSTCVVRLTEGQTIIAKSMKMGVSFDIGLKSVLGLSGDIQSSGETNISRYSLVLSVDSVANSVQVSAKSLNWNANTVLPKGSDDLKGIDYFVKSHGDCYISSVTTGGRFLAVIIINASSEKQKEELKAKLGGEAVVKGVPVKAGFSSEVKDGIEKSGATYNIFTMSVGVKGANVQLSEDLSAIDRIMAFAINLPANVDSDFPAIIARRVDGYENVPGNRAVSEALETMRNNREKLYGANGLYDGDYQTLNERLLEMRRIRMIYRVFGGYVDETLNEAEKRAGADVEAFRNVQRDYEEKPGVPLTIPTFESLKKGHPEMVTRFENSNPIFGKNEGQEYQIGWTDRWNEIPFRIARVQVDTREGFLGNVLVDYEVPMLVNGGETRFISVGTASLRTTTEKYTDTKIHPTSAIPLVALVTWTPPIEMVEKTRPAFVTGKSQALTSLDHITRISGFSGDFVDKVELFFNEAGTLIEGRAVDNNFSWEVPKGHCVIGFAGKSIFAPLGSLRPVQVIFSPTAWT